MRRICLALPTNRACTEAIAALGAEAEYAARRFGAEVRLLILDTSEPAALAGNRAAADALRPTPGVVVHHLDEERQRTFLRTALERSGTEAPDRVLGLMLPDGVSYGACTNRAFLVASALGCTSVHRRDSDGRYQSHEGEPVFPVHHELTSLGRRAADVAAAGLPTRTRLDPACADRPVALVGGSFIGEMSVDLEEMSRADPAVYHDVVGLSIPAECPEIWRRKLVDESFRGAGTTPFTRDHTTLTAVSPARVDMCNISFIDDVYERVPLPPATDTIGSDYFLTHLVHDAKLPGVLHNRHIVNYYTGERRTDRGFLAYQLRFVRFLLSMHYFNAVYARMTAAGESLLDGDGHVRASLVAGYVRESTLLDRTENGERLDVLDRAYRTLGHRYTEVADAMAARRRELLDKAADDMADFALLIDAWQPLMRAARSGEAARAVNGA
ncbi:DUF6271 family protein [Streptomyces sp. C11-1]|uniref:DUF6271 family protein n=1 Tax=Streptomyces durocortorensis TaxID=2811104 RepID=A0ABY9W3H5_9ACTN|nr:DUF6271 family protein [Streptomyces durocortorensis]WNF30710.1 DUF6271 family protein [Streptomyces durocortorensis]